MNVKLVYIVDDVEVVLHQDELEKMDAFTYNNFSSTDDILSSEFYKDKLTDLSKDGKFVLQYLGFDVPVISVDFYAALGGDPFSKSHELDVLVKEEGIRPNQEWLMMAFRNNLDSFEKVDQLREECNDFFEPYDMMIYGFGAIGRNSDACLEVLESVLDRECSKDEEYFFRRMLVKRSKEISSMQEQREPKNI